MSRTENLKNQLGLKLRELRDARDLRQNEVAEAIGIATESCGRLERGKSFPSLPTLVRVARYYEISTDELLSHARRNPPVFALSPEVARLVAIVRDVDRSTLRRITAAVKLMVAGAKH